MTTPNGRGRSRGNLMKILTNIYKELQEIKALLRRLNNLPVEDEVHYFEKDNGYINGGKSTFKK